ncbi:MAG: competence protein ComK [Peptoniphilaceae bacterium]|nr:competence protein ComK [Peptoniphilaceae bacterium]MDD7383840.1 competence protein ComK [Peptoniphilaceae bacterium]MDY3737583.1 competence protein ComK [Peptoniphilaceae bacterium]
MIKIDDISEILNKKIIAILPYTIEKVGLGSSVFLEKDIKIIKKIPTNIIKNIADSRNISIKQIKKMMKNTYKLSRNPPIVLGHEMCFFGFKYRISDIDDQRGFVNSKYVKKIENQKIILFTDEVIETFTSDKTLIKQYLNAEFFRLKEFEKVIKSLPFLNF